jgi:hypothetical protein
MNAYNWLHSLTNIKEFSRKTYTNHGKVITKEENDRLNKEYWAYVNLKKNGTVAMNNHGYEFGKEPPNLSLGPAAEWQIEALIKPKITHSFRKLKK